MTKKRPPKLKNLLKKIRGCLESGRYILTKHALVRQKERAINLAEAIHVLKTGYEEKSKDCFEQNTWKYAIRGKTIIGRLDVRIIVAFDDDEMLIITVMHVGGDL